jgi:UDP-N-acetylmuramoyl-L-alanyl-D-glutamate--2,6-diaminopimelate ligase
VHATAVEHTAEGLRVRVRLTQPGSAQEAVLAVRLLGGFNVANLLGVVGVGLACGLDLAQIARAAPGLAAPPGRLESVQAPDGRLPLAIVDYAHTPDAVVRALEAVRPLAQARGGGLWIVFGAGGNRDRGKRPAMAAAAAAGADRIVLTSDNPRDEDPVAILDDMAAGLPAGTPCLREADRARAIAAALDQADAADVVLIAGKGHEDYQEIAGRRLPFSDQAVARAALQARAGRIA